MNKDESISFMKELLKKYSLTQTRLASEIGTTKQYVNALCKGTRNISYEYLQKITDIYPMPEYMESSNYVVVPYLNDSKTKIYLDRSILSDKTFNISINNCRLINIITDSMSPDYKLGDRAIIDTSVQHFIDSQIFVFSMNDNTYIRRVNVMPNQIKCTADNDTYDTFYLQQGDEYKIIGALVPRIRL
jgi:transcriptional regulator with XRE-family HTH domain